LQIQHLSLTVQLLVLTATSRTEK